MTGPNQCSFCGKSKEEVFLLIQGPAITICDDCVEDAHRIVLEERQKVLKVSLPLIKLEN